MAGWSVAWTYEIRLRDDGATLAITDCVQGDVFEYPLSVGDLVTIRDSARHACAVLGVVEAV